MFTNAFADDCVHIFRELKKKPRVAAKRHQSVAMKNANGGSGVSSNLLPVDEMNKT